MKVAYKIPVAVTLLTLASVASAHCHDKNYYIGGGFNLNSQPNNQNDSTGYQFMGGYCLDYNFNSSKSQTAFEVGYMSTGNFNTQETGGKKNKDAKGQVNAYKGLWLSTMAEYRLEQKLKVMGRIGLDMGDANGLFFGAGVGYNITSLAQFRAEYVIRDIVDSFQVNLISEF